MSNQKDAVVDNMPKKSGARKRWGIVLALVVLAGIAALAISETAGIVLADKGGETGHDFNVTFTKWVPNPPAMVGVVGGDVGEGTFAGEILSLVDVGNTRTIHALYHFNGQKHSLTADNQIIINLTTGAAGITGTVTDGWQKGKTVTGYFVSISCPQDPAGGCFQGALQIHAGK